MSRFFSLFVLFCAAPAWAQAPASYSLTQVHPSPFGGTASVVTDSGLISGIAATADVPGSQDPTEPYLWQDGVVIAQGAALGISRAGITDINEAGDLIGRTTRDEAPYLGESGVYFRSAAGQISLMPTPPLGDGYRQISYGGALNDAGLAAVRLRTQDPQSPETDGVTYRGAVWDVAANTLAPLPSLGGGYARAVGITNAGVVVGAAIPANGDIIHAVRWVPDAAGVYTAEDLGTIGGGTYSEANAVNEAGTIAGEATTTVLRDAQPAVWEPGQPGRLLPTPPGTSGCAVRDLNDRGVVLGRCIVGRALAPTAWFDGQPVVLQGRLDATGAGWDLREASAINNLGWIVGVATRAGFVDSDGNPELFGYLLRPNGTVANEGAPEAPAVTVGPNPASRAVTVRVGTAADVTVLDVLGRTVARERGVSEARLDVRGWAPGVYVAVVQRGGATTRTPFTVVR